MAVADRMGKTGAAGAALERNNEAMGTALGGGSDFFIIFDFRTGRLREIYTPSI
jgi:hypothetical protein